MANVVLSKGNNTRTVVSGSQQEKSLKAQGFKAQVGAEQDEMAAIIAAVGKRTRKISLPAGTDLTALRSTLQEMGVMATGAAVPETAAIGPVNSATCTEGTHLQLSQQSKNYYLREIWEVEDAEGNNFKAFTLNSGTDVLEGDAGELEVVESTATRTGKALQYLAAA